MNILWKFIFILLNYFLYIFRSKTNNVDTIPVPTIPIQPQSTVSPSKEPIETKIKEEPPVICRVLPKSEKDTYVMYVFSYSLI